MKLIIAGSRTLRPPPTFITDALEMFGLIQFHGVKGPPSTNLAEIVSGGAGGVDRAGEVWTDRNDRLALRVFPADWAQHGKAAGHIRNAEMAEYADALLLIWDGWSSGSANMRQQMVRRGKPVYEVILREVGP
jgi:hypothetical protein